MEQGVGLVVSRVVAKTRRKLKPSYRLQTIDDLDRRCKAAQLCAQNRDDIFADLGGVDRLSTLERLQAENAALLSAVLAHLASRWMIDPTGVPVGDMCTLSNSINRLCNSLGLQRRARDVTPVSLEAYLATQ